MLKCNLNFKNSHLLGWLFFIGLGATLSAQNQVRKALFVGNSYTYYNDLPKLIADLAHSGGDSLYHDQNTIGGYSLQSHATNSNTVSKIQNGSWDYLILQEHSQRPSLPLSQVEAQFYPAAYTLDSLFHSVRPTAQSVFYMTWGRENGDASNCATWPPVCTYEGMDSLLNLRYQTIADSLDAGISPVSVVWRSLRTTHPGIQLYNADESHPSLAGSFVAACTFYAVLFQKDPSLLAYNGGLDSTEAGIIKRSARDLVFDQLAMWNVSYTQLTPNYLEINEVLYDPSNSGLAGDANGDGIYDQEGDSFIEFVNTSITNFNASGYQIWDDTSATGSLRYVVPSGTFIPPNGALAVFGSGPLVGHFGGAVLLSADATASNLSLNNSGEVIGVKNANGDWVLFFDSDALSNNPNESYTRFPDVSGNFVQHASNTSSLFSPGTKTDGTAFSTQFVVESISVQSAGGTLLSSLGGSLQLTALVLPSFASNQSVNWSVSGGSAVASVHSSGLVTGLANGSVWVSATSNDGTQISDSILITVNTATNQFITSAVKIGNPKTYRAFFTLPAASTYSLLIRSQNDPFWRTSNTWSSSSLTQQNFQALEFNTTHSLRIGYEVGGNWTYGNSFDFVSDCKPMTVSAVELLAPFCAGDSAILKTITNGGFRVKSFLWNTGETTRFIYGQQGQTYTVVVTDEAGCTQSASVTVSSVNTQFTPVNFAVAKPNTVTFTGSWSPATLGIGVSLMGYRMAYRQVGVGAAWTNTALSTNTTATVNFTGSGLPSANYEFTVFARVNDNGSIYNTEYACRERRFYNGLGNKTEVDSLSSVNSWFVYPNPTSEFIIIDPKEEGQWRIFSAAGKLILSGESKPTEEQKILVTQWSVGVYLLEWQSETNLETKRFIIQ